MCNFKSGIILKNRNVLSNDENNSHSNLLDTLKIEDTTANAMRVFVRAELIPPNDEWWTDPKEWEFHVDQDIVPEWFETDSKKYEESFRNDVIQWCNTHILVDKKVDGLSSGYYMLKRCSIEQVRNSVKILCDSSTVTAMCGSSTVTEMCGSSTVTAMCDSSTVTRMYDSSTVTAMCGSSTVTEMYDSSTVTAMYGSSTVTAMYGSSIARDYQNNKLYISGSSPLEISKRGTNESK